MSKMLESGLYDYSNEAFYYVGNWNKFVKNNEKMIYSDIKNNYLEIKCISIEFISRKRY